jgi:signal transduction histidine kinase
LNDPAKLNKRMERLLTCLQKALGHELPNRLVGIQGMLQLLELEEGGRLGPDGQEYLRRLRAATSRAQAMVKALGEVCRVGRDSGPAEQVALADAVQEAAAEMKQLFPDRAIEYHCQLAVPVVGVPRRGLRQVLFHLLRNAVQAAGERQPHIEVGSRATPAGAEFWVKDNGCGLSPEQRQRLFEPFALGATGTGSQLGLVLVREIVEQWGGAIRIDSEPGRGSVFTMSVPGP